MQIDDVTTADGVVFSLGFVDTTGDYFRIRFTKAAGGPDTFFTVEGSDGTITADDVSAVTPVNATNYVFELGYDATNGFWAKIDGVSITLTNLAALDQTQFTACSAIITNNDATAKVITGTVDKFIFDTIDVW